jgi:protein gp37
MRESPQWNFMVHTSKLERLAEIDWPSNVLIGCVVDCQDSVKPAREAFKEINDAVKFVICDLHKESIAFDDLSDFNWIIIRNLSKVQPDWQRLESVLEQSLADSLRIYLMPNITVRPMEYPRLQEQNVENQMQEVVSQESVKGVA